MEPADPFGSWAALPVVIAPRPQHPIPDDETARSQMESAIQRSRELRWHVEHDFGPIEARERYPEAYL